MHVPSVELLYELFHHSEEMLGWYVRALMILKYNCILNGMQLQYEFLMNDVN